MRIDTYFDEREILRTNRRPRHESRATPIVEKAYASRGATGVKRSRRETYASTGTRFPVASS